MNPIHSFVSSVVAHCFSGGFGRPLLSHMCHRGCLNVKNKQNKKRCNKNELAKGKIHLVNYMLKKRINNLYKCSTVLSDLGHLKKNPPPCLSQGNMVAQWLELSHHIKKVMGSVPAWGLSLWILHVLPVPAWDFSVFSQSPKTCV